MRHELKTDSEQFFAVEDGVKTFELRFNDRDYQVGDILLLQETEYTGEEMKAGKPLEYTGRICEVGVSHVMRGPAYGLPEGWVIMSIKNE